MGKEAVIKCPYCESIQYQDWIQEMEEDDEEEGCCDKCNEPFLIYREDETTFKLYKLV